jgi:hypothetical protein
VAEVLYEARPLLHKIFIDRGTQQGWPKAAP